MSTLEVQLEAYNRACSTRRKLLQRATTLAEVVKNGAAVLEQDPSQWRFERSGKNLNANSIDPALWPSLGEIASLKQQYMRAVAMETAAQAALSSWKGKITFGFCGRPLCRALVSTRSITQAYSKWLGTV